jgi:hypothetical protein
MEPLVEVLESLKISAFIEGDKIQMQVRLMMIKSLILNKEGQNYCGVLANSTMQNQ